MLELDDLHVAYGRVEAVQGIALAVDEGEIVGLVGHNGAGKTTTLLATVGLLRPRRGRVVFAGRDVTGEAPEHLVRAGLCLVPEGRHIFTRLTVGENLRLGSTTRRDRSAVQADIDGLLERFDVLSRYFDKPAGKLSGGEQQQLAIARALLARPKLLLLDEPSLGLAPLVVERVFDVLRELRAEGLTVLVVEQNVRQTVALADRTYVVQAGGTIAMHGTRTQLLAMDDFETTYLGFGRDSAAAASMP